MDQCDGWLCVLEMLGLMELLVRKKSIREKDSCPGEKNIDPLADGSHQQQSRAWVILLFEQVSRIFYFL